MYGLPKDIDLSFLLGKDLEQVAIGRYCVNLNFYDDTWISIQSCFIHQSSGVEHEWIQELPPSAASSVLSLLKASIVDAKGETDGTLTCTFSNGDLLTVYDDDPHYECYQIRHKTHLYIV
jgi:Family of unknown function (DUF6188)